MAISGFSSFVLSTDIELFGWLLVAACRFFGCARRRYEFQAAVAVQNAREKRSSGRS